MSRAQKLDGAALARKLRAKVAQSIAAGSSTRHPCLAVVLVGDDPASHVYVRNKHKACEEVGIESRDVRLTADTPEARLRAVVHDLNADEAVDGILVQLPVPPQIDTTAVRSWIDPLKDVDGLHPENVGLLASGTPRFVPCTPAGCLELLREYDVPTVGRRAVVVGRSLIVGRPMATLLSTKGIDATVTLCHRRTPDLAEVCREADILVAAAGRPCVIQPDFVKPGAVVVDVGIHRVEDPSRASGHRLVGDVDASVAEVASYLSPVPGGVGPLTIAMLLSNTARAWEARTSHRGADVGTLD
jgi:methylenetetrahydrofolate dehydrogenase (NADP+)/methenyltetrahydrofolate cyclohydrolase